MVQRIPKFLKPLMPFQKWFVLKTLITLGPYPFKLNFNQECATFFYNTFTKVIWIYFYKQLVTISKHFLNIQSAINSSLPSQCVQAGLQENSNRLINCLTPTANHFFRKIDKSQKWKAKNQRQPDNRLITLHLKFPASCKDFPCHTKKILIFFIVVAPTT